MLLLSIGETEPPLDVPTAEQEREMKGLDEELERLNSGDAWPTCNVKFLSLKYIAFSAEIEASRSKINTTKECNNEIVMLKQDIMRMNKEVWVFVESGGI